MKTIGLLGGMSWQSTQIYYQLLNSMTAQRLGDLHSAKLLLFSFNFAEIEALQAKERWDDAAKLLIAAAINLEKAGADCLCICTNTMHKLADQVQASIDIPLIHIADATAKSILKHGTSKPLLLATRYTMEQAFYKQRLIQKHNIAVTTPNSEARKQVHNIIYNELCQGIIREPSKTQYLDIIQHALNKGADSIIFGCTEVGLLISASDFDVPCFDSTELHAQAAIEFSLGGN